MTVFNHQDGERLQINGALIYYEQKGNQNGPALVFLHGGLGNMETFNKITPHLGKTYRLIGIDSQGQGGSTLGISPLTYRRIQEDVEAVIQHLGLANASVIGHSDGGIVALRLAASGATWIDKIITIGAHWALSVDDPTREMYASITATDWRDMFPEEVDRYLALNPEPNFERLLAMVRLLWLDDSEEGYPGETVRSISASLLVVRGDEDQLVSRANAVELADRVAAAKLLNMPFADHSVQESQPDRLLPMLDEFLQV
ncbi:alpha/beta fold hydrolase [Lampropedia aestuarii]|uniref:alpha/beta fold hydrolase n=1 Tax=Lampropedia aestuarii TaxID=2562762 RepID=UPI0024687F9A|nr:alpha/beta hydrolase [Lampropedia aestuarii]MDH5859285.1 alpha/beta hydrolase [Lampropedia aestuarii]